jgi:hypothetical protein
MSVKKQNEPSSSSSSSSSSSTHLKNHDDDVDYDDNNVINSRQKKRARTSLGTVPTPAKAQPLEKKKKTSKKKYCVYHLSGYNHTLPAEYHFRASSLKPVLLWLLKEDEVDLAELMKLFNVDDNTESEEKKEKQANCLADVFSKLDQVSGSIKCEETDKEKRAIIYEEFIEVLGEKKVHQLIDFFYQNNGEEENHAYTWMIKEWTKPKFVSL